MGSTYLRELEEEYRAQMQQELDEICYAYQSKITSLNRDRPKKKTLTGDTLPMGLVGLVALPLSAPLAAGLSLGGMAAKHFVSSNQDQAKNEDIDTQISQLQQQEQEACRAVEEKYKQMYQQEEQRYTRAVKQARARHGGSTAMAPLIKWLSDRFEYQIRNADRRSHQDTIRAMLAFGVREGDLALLRWEDDRYKIAELFDFAAHGFRRLPNFDEQVGFSQACAKLVRFEICRRFPKDPVASGSARPTVSVLSDDDLMELYYQVPNPARRPKSENRSTTHEM